jgi:hypothetical protein
MTRRNYWEAVIADEEYLTNWNYTQYINMYIVHCTHGTSIHVFYSRQAIDTPYIIQM